MKTYDMQKLSESDEVVGKSKLVSASYYDIQLLYCLFMNKSHVSLFFLQKKTMTLNMDPRAEEGSFSDRRKKLKLKSLELLKVLKEELDSIHVAWPFDGDVKDLQVGSESYVLCLQRVQIPWKKICHCCVIIPGDLMFGTSISMHESKDITCTRTKAENVEAISVVQSAH
jgi:hypothetical protein